MHNKFNNSIQPNKVWSYYEVLEWMEENLKIEALFGNNNSMEVNFTPFPEGILGYMRQNKDKKNLKNQIIIFVCTTHHGRHAVQVNKNQVRVANRGYTIPLPQINKKGAISIIRKNWRILPTICAKNGEYQYESFFSDFPERSKPRMAAYFLGNRGGGHNSYMVAIALVNEGDMTTNVWFSNVLRVNSTEENTTSEIEIE